MISDRFEDAFTKGGGISVTCGCGREHYEDDPHAGDFDVGELERLRADDGAVGHVDGVRYAECNGILYVLGCECDKLARYEEFIWTHRREIAEYLQARATDIWRTATLEHALLGELVNGVRV